MIVAVHKELGKCLTGKYGVGTFMLYSLLFYNISMYSVLNRALLYSRVQDKAGYCQGHTVPHWTNPSRDWTLFEMRLVTPALS